MQPLWLVEMSVRGAQVELEHPLAVDLLHDWSAVLRHAHRTRMRSYLLWEGNVLLILDDEKRTATMFHPDGAIEGGEELYERMLEAFKEEDEQEQ